MTPTVVAVAKARRIQLCGEPGCAVAIGRGSPAHTVKTDDGEYDVCTSCAVKYPILPTAALEMELRIKDFHPPIIHRIDVDARAPLSFIRAMTFGGEYIQWAYQLGMYHATEGLIDE